MSEDSEEEEDADSDFDVGRPVPTTPDIPPPPRCQRCNFDGTRVRCSFCACFVCSHCAFCPKNYRHPGNELRFCRQCHEDMLAGEPQPICIDEAEPGHVLEGTNIQLCGVCGQRTGLYRCDHCDHLTCNQCRRWPFRCVTCNVIPTTPPWRPVSGVSSSSSVSPAVRDIRSQSLGFQST